MSDGAVYRVETAVAINDCIAVNYMQGCRQAPLGNVMATKADKVILTNFAALKSKYRAAGVRTIRRAIAALIAADRGRGLTTVLVGLDDPMTMRRLSGRAVSNPADARQNKQAVDAVYYAHTPDYILLLGSANVIAHQRLKNPVYSKKDDDEVDVASDLPYACEAPYGRDVCEFIGPTRVVGRLPDIPDATEPSYLVRLLKFAARARPRPPEDYADHFALTAQVWERSSRLSMQRMFVTSKGIDIVPPHSQSWPASLLARRVHFINCHGSNRSSEFYGQPASGAEDYPVSMRASYIDGKIAPGTVIAAECCFGGQIEHVSPSRPRPGICQVYLKNGAFGFVGSTNSAYGESVHNGQADLLCQMFLENVLAGASLGCAFLEARHDYLSAASPPHPLDLKTLAQFILLGDPSIVTVDRGKSRAARGSDAATMVSARSARQDRRRALMRQGLTFAKHEPVPRRIRTGTSRPIARALGARARKLKLSPSTLMTFAIHHRGSPLAMPRGLAARSARPTAFHVLFCKRKRAKGKARRGGGPAVVDLAVLVGKEVNRKLATVALSYSH